LTGGCGAPTFNNRRRREIITGGVGTAQHYLRIETSPPQ
jgi:hypothetical protein